MAKYKSFEDISRVRVRLHSKQCSDHATAVDLLLYQFKTKPCRRIRLTVDIQE